MNTSQQNRLSVAIVTHNKAPVLKKCLNSLTGITDDIVVVDAYSTDETATLCQQDNINFIQRQWHGYADAKNFAAAQAKYDWVLSLDSDEALSEKLRNAILELKAKQPLGFYKINRLNNYCGKWIKHGDWYPDKVLRLFNRHEAKWVGDYVHESLHLNSPQKINTLPGHCFHYTIDNIKQHLAKMNRYSDLAAQGLFDRGKKYSFMVQLAKTGFTFFRTYLLRLGFLDGYEGLCIAKIASLTVFLRYAKLRELEQKAKNE